MLKLNRLRSRNGGKLAGGNINSNVNKLVQCQIRQNSAPFPQRPGYGLGSMLPPGMIKGMNHEAAIRTKLVVYDRLLSDLEASERELMLELNQIENRFSDSQTIPRNRSAIEKTLKKLGEHRTAAIQKKIDTTMTLAKYQTDLLSGNGDAGETAFSVFSSNVESPVDWTRSAIKSFPRANESVDISSQFFDRNSQKQEGSSHSEQIADSVYEERRGWSTTNTTENIGNSKKLHTTTVKYGTYRDNVASTVMKSVNKTMEQHTVESTLLLTARATHRWVKQLAPAIIDANKLVAAWNFYNPQDMIDVAKLYNPQLFLAELSKVQRESKATDITTSDDGPSTIAMVSEEFLGSSMIGMVHFIKQSETTSSQDNTTSSSESTSVWEEHVTTEERTTQDYRNFWGSKRTRTLEVAVSNTYNTGDSAWVNQAATKMMESASQTGLDVVFNLVVQGYMPTMKQSIIKDSIKEFTAFSPQTVDVQSQDVFSQADRASQQLELLKQTQMVGQSVSNSGSMIRATIEGISNSHENSYRVLDFNTFMTAFDDYIQKAPRDKQAGVPVGMNVKQWTKPGVLLAYRNYFKQRMDAEMERIRKEKREREDAAYARAQAIRQDIAQQNAQQQ